MMDMNIEETMIIDDVECVKTEMEAIIGKKISNLDIAKKYICTERNTKFYIDSQMRSNMEPNAATRYVWLDTGYRDQNNHAVFLSLCHRGHEYRGHYVGTARTLTSGMKKVSPNYKNDIETNYARFVEKYKRKSAERVCECIGDENRYLLSKINGNGDFSSNLKEKLDQLDIDWKPETVIEEPAIAEPDEKMSRLEKMITMELLLELLQERELYIKELLDSLEKNKAESQGEIKKLVGIIKEQSLTIKERTNAITQIRAFNEEEARMHFQRGMDKEKRDQEKCGHKLLENRKKIMVLGATSLSNEVLKGIITKEYGFEETDFDYETDYKKVVHASGRIISSGKYQAIIFGCCPHSASGKGKWSGLIERCKQDDRICTVDARNIAGNLKVTKASFREALSEVCTRLSKAA